MENSLRTLFFDSLSSFFKLESKNIVTGVSERNLCSRLAIIIEKKLKEKNISGYYADAEYNRKQLDQVKTIINDNEKILSISCDLIVHSRGEIPLDDNLIAIEMKKSTRPPSERLSDMERLQIMTRKLSDNIWGWEGSHPKHVCGYKLGFYIDLNITQRSYQIEEFQMGAHINQLQCQF